MYLTISSLGDSGWTQHKARVEYQCMQPHARDTTFTSCVCARICQTADINTPTINSLPLFFALRTTSASQANQLFHWCVLLYALFTVRRNLSVFVYEKRWFQYLCFRIRDIKCLRVLRFWNKANPLRYWILIMITDTKYKTHKFSLVTCFIIFTTRIIVK